MKLLLSKKRRDELIEKEATMNIGAGLYFDNKIVKQHKWFWPGVSKRLLKFIFHSGIVFGYKWSAQCGNWVVLIIRNKDVYRGSK